MASRSKARVSPKPIRGVVLAGGLGRRLGPLTAITNKHLLPVWDRPMIFYPLRSLIEAGIDEVLIVTNPEVSSVRDSDRILGILGAKSKRAEEGLEPIKEHLVVTRYSPSRVESGEMLSIDDIQELLGIKLLGVIPESSAVLQASNAGVPVVRDEDSNSGQAYQDVVARFLGEERPMRFMESEKKGFLKRLFGT